jgi:acid stress-induced BolA-like protein IbaG/YrbA
VADQTLKDKITSVLKQSLFNQPGDYVAVTDGDEDLAHVLVISPQLGGKKAREKRDLIWDELMAKLAEDEWQRISLVAAKTPEEVMAE